MGNKLKAQSSKLKAQSSKLKTMNKLKAAKGRDRTGVSIGVF